MTKTTVWLFSGFVANSIYKDGDNDEPTMETVWQKWRNVKYTNHGKRNISAKAHKVSVSEVSKPQYPKIKETFT